MTQIVNMTGHPVRVYDAFPRDGGTERAVYPAAAREVRVRRDNAIRLGATGAGEPLLLAGTPYLDPPLPPEADGTLYIVSAVVATCCPSRRDLVVPGYPVKRGQEHVGCVGLVYFHDPGEGAEGEVRDADLSSMARREATL